MRNSVLTFQKMKSEGKKISMLTCYDYSTAKLMDGNIDAILVGDSLGNTMLGLGDTIPVTVDNMITYGASVVRGTETTMIVVDMPFMSYQVSMEQALENAGRVMKETHCQAIKLEGGARVCPQIKAMDTAVHQRIRRMPRTGQDRRRGEGTSGRCIRSSGSRRFLSRTGMHSCTSRSAYHEQAGHPDHRNRRRNRV